MATRIHLPRLVLLLAFLLALSSGGCIFSPGDDGEETPPVDETLPPALTPDILMENFETVYEAMDIDKYRDEVLSPDYLFVLKPETVEEFGLPDNLYNFEDEIVIAQKMFSGQPNSAGRVVSTIDFQLIQRQSPWQDVPENDPNFGGYGAKYSTFQLLMYFNMLGDFRYEVTGEQIFYVAPVPGSDPQIWRLLGQVDLTVVTP